jgi:hypothetical protein
MAAVLVLDGQADRCQDLLRSIGELHQYMKYPEILDPDSKFVRRDDGVVVLAFPGGQAKFHVISDAPG